MKIILSTLLIAISLNASDSDVLNFNRADLKKINYLQSKRILPKSEKISKNEIPYNYDNTEYVSKKNEILGSINSYSQVDFYNAYYNVLSFLENKQEKSKTLEIFKNEKMVSFLEANYKDMLKTIAHNESGFKHPVGTIDKDDVSYFQINIKKNIWDLTKLEDITKTDKISRKQLIEDYHFAGKVALHVLLYNISLYASNNNISDPQSEDLKKFIASYNHPYKLKDYYMQSAENFLATL